MKRIASLAGLALALAILTGGCTARIEPYESMIDLERAMTRATLVVQGDVKEIQTVKHFVGEEVASSGLGKLGVSCVAHEQVALTVAQTLKGNAAPGQTITFSYHAPCFHPVKGIHLIREAPALLDGDKATVYLENRNGQWWMIAHEIQPPPQEEEDSPSVRQQIY